MNQKNIRPHNGNPFSVAEAVEWLKELDDRTKSSQTGYNSIDELATVVKKNEGKESNGGLLIQPVDSIKSYEVPSNVGAIKITLPQSWTNTMMFFQVWVFNFAQNKSMIINLSGYNRLASAEWQNTSATIISSLSNNNHTIRFGHDGNKCCVYIGELNSNWMFPKISVLNFLAGFKGKEKNKWINGWDISFETASFQNITKTHTNNLPVSQ